MFLYPFKTVWLKTTARRAALAEMVAQQTYLSDAGYRKRDRLTKYFYGLVNENEFVLENIGNTRIPGFFEGDILGVEEETYIKLRMGALRHTRIYLMYMILLCAGLYFWVRATTGIDLVDSGIVYTLSAILLLLTGYGFRFLLQFRRKVNNGIDFFRGLLNADIVESNDVPSIFKR
jgi:hypothetical protein